MGKTVLSLQTVSLRLFASYGSTYEGTFETHLETNEEGYEEEESTWIAKGKVGSKKKEEQHGRNQFEENNEPNESTEWIPAIRASGYRASQGGGVLTAWE